MNYDFAERSNQSSRPVALYEFWLGEKSWFYAQSETDFEMKNPYDAENGKISYIASNISDEGVSQTGVADAEDVTLNVLQNLPVARLFIGVPPSEEVFVIMRRGDASADVAPIYWVGTVKSVAAQGKISAKMTCAMLTSSFKRQGLRLSWQRSCPYSLYDSDCRVNPALWRQSFPIESMNGAAIFSSVAAGFEQGKYVGGFVEWQTEFGTIERRSIEQQVPYSLVILEGTEGLTAGMTVNVYPGCKLTEASCESYNNYSNYGGFTMMPGKSPFDGSPVF